MSERRFVIFEDLGSDWKYAKESITESELDDRLTAIYALTGDYTFFEKAKAILLNGENKEGSMSERTFDIWVSDEEGVMGRVASMKESEFHRRIDAAFRAAFCTLTEKFDFNKAMEIIVHGEGEKGDEHG